MIEVATTPSAELPAYTLDFWARMDYDISLIFNLEALAGDKPVSAKFILNKIESRCRTCHPATQKLCQVLVHWAGSE